MSWDSNREKVTFKLDILKSAPNISNKVLGSIIEFLSLTEENEHTQPFYEV